MSSTQWIQYLARQNIYFLNKTMELESRIEVLEKKVHKNTQTYSGNGKPTSALGEDCDSYIQLDNGSIWKKNGEEWELGGCISMVGEAFTK